MCCISHCSCCSSYDIIILKFPEGGGGGGGKGGRGGERGGISV